jgi:hypothetical protein
MFGRRQAFFKGIRRMNWPINPGRITSSIFQNNICTSWMFLVRGRDKQGLSQEFQTYWEKFSDIVDLAPDDNPA